MGATLSCLGPGGAQDSFPSDRQSVARELLGLARAGNYHRIKALVETLAETSREFNERRGSYLNCRDVRGRTPLILACKGRHAGHRGVVELLIAQGVDLDASYGSNHMTALHTAVGYRRVEIAALLVRAGASPFVETAAGLTAHDMVIREGLSLDLLRLMESRGVYAGWVEMRVGRYRRPWEKRWVVLTQRIRYGVGGSDGRIRVMMSCYPHVSTYSCVCRTWICGSQASGVGTLVDLALAPGVRKPKGARCRKAGDRSGRWVLDFRPASGDGQSEMEDFKACLNWAASLGADGGVGGQSRVEVQQPQQQQLLQQDHWANEPPGYLTGPEASSISLASTASTLEHQDSELIPAIHPFQLASGASQQGDSISHCRNEDTSAAGNECIICLDRKVEFVFCHARDGETGCAVACAACNAKYESTACPVCRRQITGRIKVYGL